MKPLVLGGHQERGRRAGTENVPYIVGLGVACELAGKKLGEENTRVQAMRDRLEKGILESCPGARLNGDPAAREDLSAVDGEGLQSQPRMVE